MVDRCYIWCDWIRTLLFVKSKRLTEEKGIEFSLKANVAAYFKDGPLTFIIHAIILLPVDIALYFLVSAYWSTMYRFLTRMYHLGSLSELLTVFRKMKANPVQKLLIQMVLMIYLSI